MSKKFFWAFVLLISLSLQAKTETSLANYRYYPDSLLTLLNSSSSRSITKLKEALFETLSSAHLFQAKNAHDLLAASCKGPQNLESCYSQKKDLTYLEARKILFGKLHLYKKNGEYQIKDVYCNRVLGQAEGVGPGKIPASSEMNCEHTWPQSLFNPKFPENQQKVDLHHLYPVDSRANSTRGNHQERDLVEGQELGEQCTSAEFGSAQNQNEIITAFSPPAEHRGNVARALFYFSVRYKLSIDADYENNLRRWNKQDPVDDFEKQRNEEIYKIQFNRNPFIDDPSLADRVSDF